MPKKNYNTKTEITKLVNDILDKEKKKKSFYDSREFEKTVEEISREVSRKVIENLYRSLWVKRNIWKNDL